MDKLTDMEIILWKYIIPENVSWNSIIKLYIRKFYFYMDILAEKSSFLIRPLAL